MKITIINNRPSTGNKIYCVDGTSVAPGSSHAMTGRTAEEALLMLAQQDGNNVMVRIEIEGNDKPPVVCTMKNPANPAIDALFQVGCGFDLLNLSGGAANVAPTMLMGVYDDLACTVPSTTAILDTATTGTIVSGSGTNLVEVTPSAAGVFACRCSIPAAANKVVYMKGYAKGTTQLVDAASTDTLTFTKT